MPLFSGLWRERRKKGGNGRRGEEKEAEAASPEKGQTEIEWAGKEVRDLLALAEWGDWEWAGLVC